MSTFVRWRRVLCLLWFGWWSQVSGSYISQRIVWALILQMSVNSLTELPFESSSNTEGINTSVKRKARGGGSGRREPQRACLNLRTRFRRQIKRHLRGQAGEKLCFPPLSFFPLTVKTVRQLLCRADRWQQPVSWCVLHHIFPKKKKKDSQGESSFL